MTEADVFAGIGGFALAARWMGWDHVFNCEIQDYQRSVLKRHFPDSEQYSDIRNLDATKYNGKIDVLTGGFPCQDISAANFKAVGIMGERSGLWGHYARIIQQVRPRYVVIENSPQLLRKGFEKVLFDLSKIGYHAEWDCFTASATGLPHKRERLYIVAYSDGIRQPGQGYILENARNYQASRDWQTNRVIDAIQRKTLPPLCDSNNGFSTELTLKSLGNSVIPYIPYSIFKAIESHEHHHQTKA